MISIVIVIVAYILTLLALLLTNLDTTSRR